jgi:DNA polymerase
MGWEELGATVAGCTACGLCKTRTNTVFGVGHRQAQWMLIGEAPGAEEDARGEPFVGQAGKLLDNMLASVGLSRAGDAAQAVYIANVLKCRPPGNRNPEPGEVALCEPFLQRQVALVQPRVIVVMGRFAAQALLGTDATIASLRGRVHQVQVGGRAIPVIVTYHPAYLLRNLADKAKSWADLCLAQGVLQSSTLGPRE